MYDTETGAYVNNGPDKSSSENGKLVYCILFCLRRNDEICKE